MPLTASTPSERLPRTSTRARSRGASTNKTGRAKARKAKRVAEAVGAKKPKAVEAKAGKGKRAAEAKGVAKAKRTAGAKAGSKARVGRLAKAGSKAKVGRPTKAASKASGLKAPRKAIPEPVQQPDPTHAFLGLATATGLALAFSYALAKPTALWKLGWAGLALLTLVSLAAAALSFKDRDRPVLAQVAGWFMLAVAVCLVGGAGYLALFNPLGFAAPGGGKGRAAVFGFWCLVGVKLGSYAKSLLGVQPVSPAVS